MKKVDSCKLTCTNLETISAEIFNQTVLNVQHVYSRSFIVTKGQKKTMKVKGCYLEFLPIY